LNARRYDVIHFHNISLFGPGILALAPAGPPPIKAYTTHEHWLVCPTHVLWKFNERACERPDCLRCTLQAKRPPQLWRYTGLLGQASAHVDLFLAPSRFTARMHRERGFDRPFDVLPLFVDVPDDDWSEAPLPHPRPYFLFVGRLERLKGVDVLLRAAAAVPDADLVIVGAGSDEPRLKAMASSSPRVRFLGAMPQTALGPWYGHALACCIPSLTYEPFPTVAIEAFARRTPVVAHDLGGLTEIVEESGAGILYRTEAELVAGLRRIAADTDARTLMGERGHRAVSERWSRRAHLAQYFALLDRVSRRRLAPAS
jgi:glycosyltransferase involved in cell wall biosynthesis